MPENVCVNWIPMEFHIPRSFVLFFALKNCNLRHWQARSLELLYNISNRKRLRFCKIQRIVQRRWAERRFSQAIPRAETHIPPCRPSRKHSFALRCITDTERRSGSMMKKRLTSLALSAMMVLSMVPATAFAAKDAGTPPTSNSATGWYEISTPAKLLYLAG